MQRALLALLALAAAPSALADDCAALTARVGTEQGAGLVQTYGALLRCDSEAAGAAFQKVVTRATDTETAVGVALTAIDAKAYAPVWGMLDLVADYSQRDAIAQGVGAACGEHPEVVTFLQGAYFGLRNTQFGRWAPALAACESEGIVTWLGDTASKPPAVTYDEKYNTILAALVARQRTDALPVLQRAAVEASANGGPFNAIIEKMGEAVQPVELGGDVSPADAQKLEQTLVSVANAVAPEQAAMVADRLYNAGSEAAAASLLPRVYPDRVQLDGSLRYGVAAVEACDGQAVVHYASVTEPARRWSVLTDVEPVARAFKPRLKCAAGDPWAVVATPEPVANDDAVLAWVEELSRQHEAKGATVKLRAEKPFSLQ